MDLNVRKEPKSLSLGGILLPPLGFFILTSLIYLGTNMMPFFSDGSRMDLMHGLGTVLLEKKGSFTPLFGEAPEAFTSVAPPAETLPRNEITAIPWAIADTLKLDIWTSGIITLLLFLVLFSVLVNIMELPFSVAEVRLDRMAHKPSISNKRLKGAMGSMLLSSFLISLGISTAGALLFPQILLNLEDWMRTFYFNPIFLVFIPVFLSRTIPFHLSVRGYLNALLIRRCSNCFHMDTIKIIGKDYVGTRTTTIDRYKTTTYNDGSSTKRWTGSETRNHDVHDYTFQCTNCGETSKSRF